MKNQRLYTLTIAATLTVINLDNTLAASNYIVDKYITPSTKCYDSNKLINKESVKKRYDKGKTKKTLHSNS